ncbi:hypothetical protein BO71DRAFT_294805, partial [Aspergillus ellipticus CBS 707.79]
YRTLAPRQAPEPQAPPPPPEGKTKRASTACTECKRRRTRCSAGTTGIPCTECSAHDWVCEVDIEKDRRRKESVKRTECQLEYYKDFLEALLQVIRESDLPATHDLVALIRSGARLDDIRTLV